MRILALETSAKAVSAAVTEDGKVLCSGYQDTGLTHSRTLMPIVEAMLKNTGLTVQDCDAVAVAAGPGSFTGIRIGVSAAKGLAFAADKPCAAVSTLEAMARNVAHMDALVVCAMDARRSQIYNALFTSEHGRLTRRTPDRAIGLAELAEELRSEPLPLVIVGDGAVLCESAAVTEDGKVLCSGYQDTGLTHSRTLMPIVEAMLKNTGLTVQDCDAVAVAAGPGSFTGIRIGVSAAKGLAFAADKPCAAVSTLEAMARNVAHMDALVVCAMDARRSQIYNALFTSEHGRLTRRTPDRAIGLAELAEELRSEPLPLVIVGDGAVLCEKALTESGLPCRLAPPQLVMQNAMSVALCAEDLARAGKLVSAQELLPVYLRPPQAQRLRQPPQI